MLLHVTTFNFVSTCNFCVNFIKTLLLNRAYRTLLSYFPSSRNAILCQLFGQFLILCQLSIAKDAEMVMTILFRPAISPENNRYRTSMNTVSPTRSQFPKWKIDTISNYSILRIGPPPETKTRKTLTGPPGIMKINKRIPNVSISSSVSLPPCRPDEPFPSPHVPLDVPCLRQSCGGVAQPSP